MGYTAPHVTHTAFEVTDMMVGVSLVACDFKKSNLGKHLGLRCFHRQK